MKVKRKFLRYSLDFIGIFASLVCAIHCIALPFILTISTLGNLIWFKRPELEWAFITFSIIIAASSLLWSFFQKHQKTQVLWIAFLGIILIIGSHIEHGADDHWLTAFGGILLAAAHMINWLYLQKRFQYSISNRQLLVLSFTVMLLLAYKFTQEDAPSIENREELLELVWETK